VLRLDTTEALDVLGLPAGADLAGARAAYRGRVRAAHPDLAPDDADAHARTARLTEAYEVIVAYVEAHGAMPSPPPAPEPAPPPPPPAADEPPVTVDTGGGRPEAVDEATILLALPASETYAVLYEAAGRVGDIAYYDRRLGILEIIVRFEGGPSCSVVMTLQGRAHHTEVFCTMESIESTPAPAIAPVIDALVHELRGLRAV
jgi:hypothetical protein